MRAVITLCRYNGQPFVTWTSYFLFIGNCFNLSLFPHVTGFARGHNYADVIKSGGLNRWNNTIYFETLEFTFNGKVVHGNEIKGSFESKGSKTFQLYLGSVA